MRKIFILMFVMILLVGTVSAFEFDNVLTYENNNMNVKINDCDLWIGTCLIKGEDLGVIELKSHSSVTEVNKFGFGKEEVVMYYDFTNWNFTENGLGDIKFTDMNTDKEIQKDYSFVIWEEIDIPNYIYQCSEFVNGTIKKNCLKIQEGTIKEFQWIKYNSLDIPEENVRIGLKTYVGRNDWIDGVWAIAGKEIDKHVSWSGAGGLREKTQHYYKFDGNDFSDETGVNDGTNDGTTNIVGKINQARFFNGDDVIDFTNESFESDITYSFWIQPNWTNVTGDGAVIFTKGIDSGELEWISLVGDEIKYWFDGSITAQSNYVTDSANLIDETMYHIVITGSVDTYEIWVDGVNQTITSTNNGDRPTTETPKMMIGGDDTLLDKFTTGIIDEFLIGNATMTEEEILFLYNDGDGCSFDVGCDGPEITLNSPIDFFNSSTNEINFNASIVSDSFKLIENVSIFINGVLNQTDSSGLNDSNYLFTVGLSEGIHNWSYQSFNNESVLSISETRNITIHALAPKSNITNPGTSIDFHALNTNITINWTIVGTFLDTCILEYEGVNNTVICSNNGTEINITTILNKSIIFYVNDSFGLENSTSFDWNYKVFENNQTFNDETTEGGLETFLANIELGSGLSISTAAMVYNDSLNIGQSFKQGNSTILRNADFNIPSVDTDTNVTFLWNLTLSDSTKINLTSHNQTILNLGLDNCTTFTNQILNFTVVDEELQTALPNAIIEIAVNIFDKERNNLVLNYSQINSTIDTLSICLNLNISTGVFYSLDSIIRYEEILSANEYYNIINLSLTNGTARQNITLFDLNLSDSTEFQLTFTGADFLPVENALVNVDRQYISENIFKTVELPKTDFNGQTILHLVRNEVIYNLRISKDGVVLGNFENIVAFCDDFSIGDCNIELNAFDSVTQIFDTDKELGITFTPVIFNDTLDTISFNFLTSDGSAKEVRLEVTRNDIFGNNSICNSTLISSGGTLTCSIDPALEDTTLNTDVFVDDILTVVDSVQLDSTNFGSAGYLIMFVVAMSFILMFSGSKTGVLVSLVLTLATSIGLGLISSNLIGAGASGIWLLIMIVLGIWKLNKERAA